MIPWLVSCRTSGSALSYMDRRRICFGELSMKQESLQFYLSGNRKKRWGKVDK